MKFEDNIRYLKGVGEKRAELFKQLGVDCVGALLRLYPRNYIDRSAPLMLCKAPFNEKCCIKATVTTDVKEIFVKHGMVLYKFIATDGNENVEITLFNTKYTAKNIKNGSTYLFYGIVERNLFSCSMSSPEIFDENEQTIMPIYPQTAGLNSKTISKIIKSLLEQFSPAETLPQNILYENELCNLSTAIKNIHFPKNAGQLHSAKKRLVFEELFFLQAGILFQKAKRDKSTNIIISSQHFNNFLQLLPFTLTDAQQRAIQECLNDMSSGHSMSRLIQGDVGSGKTVVAAALCYCAVKQNYQAVIMAPTEVLATQHYKTFCSLLKDTNIKSALLTGSVTKAKKEKIKAEISNGEFNIIIGTHAVLQDNVIFQNLGLVITDEQHRFGVEQRTILSSKGNNPHMLVMSATPIPRTMSLIFYGDLDISIIDSLPKGRQPINTYLINSNIRNRAFNYIKNHLDKGLQGYIVCPMVEENEEIDLAAATKYFKDIKSHSFSNYSVGLLHGKMKPKEKDLVMQDFADGKIQLLVATTVIEVGIDVPNAVIMLIENAERFGLSQLHQLRGRIGRGNVASTCILLSDIKGGDSKQRLQLMCRTNNGFKIADEDLKARGPGDFLGKRQHGLPELKIADLSDDMELFTAAGLAAKKIYSTDSNLVMEENKNLRLEINRLFNTVKNYGYN